MIEDMADDNDVDAEAPRPVVTTHLGPVRGRRAESTEGAVNVWRGMPFAAAPVGELRWRRAQPPVPYENEFDAGANGPVCPQEKNPAIALGPGTEMSEDCLRLNVWAPAGATPESKLPVMVWIHGGAYVFGSGTQPLYDGTQLAATGDVVVVTFNYRLGALGFADLSTLGEQFETNTALSDVLAALRWVQETIEAFGGDPANVTVFGESAGGGIVTTLLTMPVAEGLFHRAIAQSSPATSMYDHDRARRVTRSFLRALGVGAPDGETPTPEALFDPDPAAIVAASMRVFADVPADSPGTIAFAPVIDGDLVQRHPIDVYRDGSSLPVPLLIGTNRDEANLFKWMKSPLMPITPHDITRMFADIAREYPHVTLPARAEIIAAYSGLKPKVAGLGVARDVAFRMPTLWVADAHSTRAPVFVYRFDWATRMLRALRLGAAHATELPYVWGNLVAGSRDITFLLGGRADGADVSRRLMRRWTSFARTGVPHTDEVHPEWPGYHTGTRSVLVVDAQDRVVDDLDADLRRTWGDEVLGFR